MKKSVTNSIVFLCHANVYFSDIKPCSGGASHNAKGLAPFFLMLGGQVKEDCLQ
jgi:hypothetical protein